MLKQPISTAVNAGLNNLEMVWYTTSLHHQFMFEFTNNSILIALNPNRLPIKY